ncbi:MAG: hypothetical protein Q8916_08420 [Bacteroidota bacterium]|nr:hypothetical protein [Bacteroidota bacterium]
MPHPLPQDTGQFDAEGWLYISYPPQYSKLKNGPVLSYLNNLDDPDQMGNIIQHFESRINDKQIRNVLKYFAHVQIPFWSHSFKYQDLLSPAFHVIQKDLYTDNGRIDKVFFGVEYDPLWDKYRISSIRVVDARWKVRKTILSIEQPNHKWHKIQHLFQKGLEIY